MSADSYLDHVRLIEEGLGPHGFRTEQATSFLNGRDIVGYYEDRWGSPEGRAGLENRTPLMIERDRIVYSDEFRRMTDRYHILFQGRQRIFRNYMTQTLRSAHVARSVSAALGLNPDFAEAMALGSKVGAVPFVHVAKKAAADWASATITAIDAGQEKHRSGSKRPTQAGFFDVGDEMTLPGWLAGLSSGEVKEDAWVRIPWAAGNPEEPIYASGKESFWLLSTDPFLRVPRQRPYLPETLYGIWRHSKADAPLKGSFLHHSPLWQNVPSYTGISLEHATHEAQVVRFADDIAWIVENLNDANTAARLSGGEGPGPENRVYAGLNKYLQRREAPEPLRIAIAEADSGGIYTFFINDLVKMSRTHLEGWDSGAVLAVATRDEVPVRLSPAGEGMLNDMESYLREYVFRELRVENRNIMLEAITRACLDVLYRGERDHLPQFLETRRHLEGWSPEESEQAMSLLDDPVHRLQLAIDILASMSDQEVYDFTGLESI